MSIEIEVCIDNLESLHNAIEGGADRIELCSSLALGGLTPSAGMMKQAVSISSVPVYAMIRPRQGDFIFDNDDIECMTEDIHTAAKLGLQGVVLGVLTSQGEINMPAMRALTSIAHHYKLGITFHRAIDQCRDFQQALESIIELGCERVLTSGLAVDAQQGIKTLNAMVEISNHRVDIMAGAGVNAENALTILKQGCVSALHLSGKSTRPSLMTFKSRAQMGSSEFDDYTVPVTDSKKIKAIKTVIQTM